MDPVVRFWLLVLAVTGTIVSAITLIVSSFLPGALFGETATLAYVVSVFVALISLGVLVWSLAVAEAPEGDQPPGTR